MRDPERRLHRQVRETFRAYAMAGAGDRILLGLSGGKDSFALARMLLKLRREVGFSLGILHFQHEYVDAPAMERQAARLRELGAEDLRIRPFSLRERLRPGRELNCFWCSRQWRAGLLEAARQEGFTAIALGHTLDDLLVTLMMNMVYRREVSALDPVFSYRDYPVRVIRPLIQADEGAVREFLAASGEDSLVVRTACPFESRTRRDRFQGYLDALEAGEGAFVKEHLFEALRGIGGRHLP